MATGNLFSIVSLISKFSLSNPVTEGDFGNA